MPEDKQLKVLFLSQGRSMTNNFNFVPVLLASMLEDQPNLGLDKIGNLTYANAVATKVTSYHSKAADKADVVCSTVFGVLRLRPWIAQVHEDIRASNPDALFIVGGPVNEVLATDVLIRTRADFYFAGSALWSFRKFCEHVKGCKEKGIPLDRDYLRTLPGLYQCVRSATSVPEIIAPHPAVQETGFISQLVLYPEPLFDHNAFKKKEGSRVEFPYPMYDRCTGGCAFCDYDPVGVPLRRDQKAEYVSRLRDLSEERGMNAFFRWFGPNFDFGDEFYLQIKEALHIVMCKVVALLKPGEVGARLPNKERIDRILMANTWHISFGVESLLRELRDEMAKQPFTNEELVSVLDAIRTSRCRPEKKKFPVVALFIMPPDMTSNHCGFWFDLAELYLLHMDLLKKQPFLFTTSGGDYPFSHVYPETPDFELLRMFHERFPGAFNGYNRYNIYEMSSRSQIPKLYLYSIPLDPIVRVAAEMLGRAMKKHDALGLSKQRLERFSIPIQAYYLSLALRALKDQYMKSGVVLHEEYKSSVSRMLGMDSKLITRIEHDGIIGLGDDREVLRKLRELFEAEYESRGRRRLEQALKTTPIKDPKAFDVWNNSGEIRKAMAVQRKAGNPEWREAGRRMLIA